MPTYDYRCEHCGKMQISQRITESALENCPKCDGHIKRIISKNIGVMFKGSGFYCKDNSNCLTPASSGKDDFGSDINNSNESAEKDYYVVDDSSSKAQDNSSNKPASAEKKPSTEGNKKIATAATA